MNPQLWNGLNLTFIIFTIFDLEKSPKIKGQSEPSRKMELS